MRNFSGRVIGGVLIAIAVGWILQLAGAFPFRGGNRTANQFVEDRPPVQNPSAFVAQDRQPVQSFRPDGSAQVAQDATPPAPPANGTTPDSASGGTDTSGLGASGGSTDTTPGSSGTASTGTGSTGGGGATQPDYSGAPAVRAGW
jgi:uncharacterized membrane protein YgcG